MSRGDLQKKMAIALGGRAAEALFFSDISTGAADDLDRATEIARAMVTRYGMSQKFGLATFEHEPAPTLGGQLPIKNRDFSEETARMIDREVERLLTSAFEIAMDIISQYRSMIEESVQILLMQETLDEAELQIIWNKYQGLPSFEQRVTA
jgi:cell division protease FtsH